MGRSWLSWRNAEAASDAPRGAASCDCAQDDRPAQSAAGIQPGCALGQRRVAERGDVEHRQTATRALGRGARRGRLLGRPCWSPPTPALTADAVDAGDQVVDVGLEALLAVDDGGQLGVDLHGQERLDEGQRRALLRQVDAADALHLVLPRHGALERLPHEGRPVVVGAGADVPRPAVAAVHEAVQRGGQAQRAARLARVARLGRQRAAHGPGAVVGKLLALARALAGDDAVDAATAVRRGALR